MPKSTQSRPFFVYHVNPATQGGDQSCLARLNAAGVEMLEVTDVYRALARLGRMNANDLRAVVVCVDGMARRELAFFPLLSRVVEGVSVYVYGSEPAMISCSATIEAVGAKRLDDSAIGVLSAPTMDLDVDSAPNLEHSKPIMPAGVDIDLEDRLLQQCAKEDQIVEEQSEGPVAEPSDDVKEDDLEGVFDPEYQDELDLSRFDAPEPVRWPGKDLKAVTELTEASHGESEVSGGVLQGDMNSTAGLPQKERLGAEITIEDVDVPAEELVERLRRLEGESSASTDLDASGLTGTPDNVVRVPWGEYSDAPTRTPPDEQANSAHGDLPPNNENTSRAQDDDDLPLITDEELDALIGDRHGESDTRQEGEDR